jgi:hypothetical protein
MGIAPISQTSIPRPLYHYTIPFYVVLSLILYLLTTRLVQPTMRWRLRRKDLLIGFGSLLLVIGLFAAAYFATASRYEWALNSQPGFMADQGRAVAVQAFPVPMIEPAIMERREVIVKAEALPPTPTPASPLAAAGEQAAPGENTVLDEPAMAEIYAAVARRMYTVDHSFGNNSPEWPVVYLLSVTDDGVGDPGAGKGASAQLSEAVMAGVSERLSDLPIDQLEWIEFQKQAVIDANNGMVAGGKGVIITFGNIHPQADGSVHVSASLYFANLGANGKTFILSQVGGVWVVTGTTGVEWMS